MLFSSWNSYGGLMVTKWEGSYIIVMEKPPWITPSYDFLSPLFHYDIVDLMVVEWTFMGSLMTKWGI
jgi:hypothetical protein